MWRRDGWLEFVVTGPGAAADAEALERLQADAWRRDQAAWADPGSGLCVARRLARLLGGDVPARADAGTTLLARFPAEVPWSVTVGGALDAGED
ncbi:MAG: ATP-binding protein [Myxococcota bacterium]